MRGIKIETKMRMIFPLLAVLAAGCGHGGGSGGDDKKADAKDPPAPTVQVAAVTRGTLERLTDATGTLQAVPTQEATLSPPVGGVLDALFVRYGQTVRKGQVVAQLSTRQLTGQIQQAQATIGQNRVQVQQAQANALQQQAQTRASVLQAQSGLANARAALAGAEATLTGSEAGLLNARQSLDRAKTLYADGLVAQKDVEAAQLALRTAQAQRDAQIETVAGQKSDRRGPAGRRGGGAGGGDAGPGQAPGRAGRPAAGAERPRGADDGARPGGTLHPARAARGPGLLGGGDRRRDGGHDDEGRHHRQPAAFAAQNQSPEQRRGTQVHRGQPLTFTVGGLKGRVFRTTVESVAPSVDAVTGTVPALALVANSSRLLRDDTIARVQIVTERRENVLLVPRAALLSDPDTGKSSVVTVGADGTAHVVPVQTGLSAGGQVEITDGVAEGQKVAVAGQYGLPDGAKVEVQAAPAPDAPGGVPAADVHPGAGTHAAPSLDTQPAPAATSGGSGAPTPAPSPAAGTPPPAPSAPAPPAPANAPAAAPSAPSTPAPGGSGGSSHGP